MSKYDFTTIINREGTSAMKVNQDMVKNYLKLNYYEDTISMWVADMEFKCPPQVIEAIKQRAEHGIFGYTGISNAYYDSVIKWCKERYQAEIKKEWVVYSQGTIPAIRNAIRAFTNEGEGIIIQPPVYGAFAGQTQGTNRKVVTNPLKKDDHNHYSIDFDDFEEKCKDPNNKMFIFCNPHNPIGRVWNREETQRLMTICHENDVLFFSDEVHGDLIRRGTEFVSAMDLENNEKAITVISHNKTFNMAGLHVTNLIIKDETLRKKLSAYTGVVRITSLALEGATTAYEACGDWVDELNEVIDRNLEYMEQFIREKLPKIKFVKPEGTYLVWVDFNGFGLSEEEILTRCADEAHLILEGGSMFGEESRGFIRMNVACPKAMLEEAMERLYNTFSE